MRSAANPYSNPSGLIEEHLGTAYQHVKTLAESIKLIQHISENMQAVYDFASMRELFDAFIDNPDFLPWLQANADKFDDLADLLNTTLAGYAPLASPEFTGFVKLGETSPGISLVHLSGTTPVLGADWSMDHGVDVQKIISVSGTITTLAGKVEPITADGRASFWLDGEKLRVSVGIEAAEHAARPFNVVLTLIE